MADLSAVHDRLRDILAPYRQSLVATKDGPGGLALELPGLEGKPWGYVAGTGLGKRYVSYYLMPVYASPDLVRLIVTRAPTADAGQVLFQLQLDRRAPVCRARRHHSAERSGLRGSRQDDGRSPLIRIVAT